MAAIAEGNPEQIDLVLDAYGDILTDAQQQLGKAAAQKFRSTAKDWIAQKCKGSINSEFPSELRNNTLQEIKNGTDAASKKAWKLLNSNRFRK